MANLSAEIGNKSQGLLWKSDDWNRLVRFVDELDERLFGADGLAARVDELTGHVAGLREGLDGVGRRLETLFGQLRRLTLEAPRSRFALGELAEVTARLTDLDGNPLGAAGDRRPAVDFVTTWGFLRAAPGFAGRLGSDGRSMTVPVDAEGVARVRLRPDHADGFSEQAEEEVAGALTTVLPNLGISVSEALLRAETPNQARLEGSFAAITAEYERPRAELFRGYADSYFLSRVHQPNSLVNLSPAIIATPTVPWRQERATVLAFARDDDDPLTADPGRAFASISLVFVDWIRHWIVTDYLTDFERPAGPIREQLAATVTADPARTSREFLRRIGQAVRSEGILGRQRDFLAVDHALETLPVAAAPPHVAELRDSVRDAVSLQRALDNTQFATATGEREEVAFQVFTRVDERRTSGFGNLGDRVAGLEALTAERADLALSLRAEIETLDGQLTTLQTQRLPALETRVEEAALAGREHGQELRNLTGSFNLLKGQVDVGLGPVLGPNRPIGGGVIGGGGGVIGGGGGGVIGGGPGGGGVIGGGGGGGAIGGGPGGGIGGGGRVIRPQDEP